MNRRVQQELIDRLRRDADRICSRFGLRYTSLDPERANVKRRYGICYDDGSIKIRLRHAATGEALKYSSLVNTLCHELAHLKHFNHGPHFKAYYARLLEWSRREGIYRPGPVRQATGVAAVSPMAGPLQQCLGADAGLLRPPRPSSDTARPAEPARRPPGRGAGRRGGAIRPGEPLQLDLFTGGSATAQRG